ncbi:hypothetical protein [Bradyrhizobium sp. 2TAF24]|uniref:hypothetical protein n=1 Tax=Bradyrhizobium sp. 2TAF24 TaxID=3233011 RepID=UPI003F901E97
MSGASVGLGEKGKPDTVADNTTTDPNTQPARPDDTIQGRGGYMSHEGGAFKMNCGDWRIVVSHPLRWAVACRLCQEISQQSISAHKMIYLQIRQSHFVSVI